MTPTWITEVAQKHRYGVHIDAPSYTVSEFDAVMLCVAHDSIPISAGLCFSIYARIQMVSYSISRGVFKRSERVVRL